MIGYFVILVLVVAAAHEVKTIESRNINSTELENGATNSIFDDSELKFIQSALEQLNIRIFKKDSVLAEDVDGKSDEASNSSNASDEEETWEKPDETNALKTSGDGNKMSRSGAEPSYYDKKKRKNIYNEDSKTNRRLDFEDNGDGFSDLVDIDNPNSNDYNQDEVEDIRATRRRMGYGAMLDMKGRSSNDVSVSTTTNQMDRPFYPAMTRRGLLFSPTFFSSQHLQPSFTFTKVDNRDMIHPMGRQSHVPFRRLQDEARDTERASIAQDFDTDGNAYKFEPEGTVPRMPAQPLIYGR